jgi:hypothetical protein
MRGISSGEIRLRKQTILSSYISNYLYVSLVLIAVFRIRNPFPASVKVRTWRLNLSPFLLGQWSIFE